MFEAIDRLQREMDNLHSFGWANDLILPPNAPASPVSGSIYWDEATNRLYVYNAGTTTWKNVALGGHDIRDNLSDLLDIGIVIPSNGQVLKYNSTSGKWENATGGAGGAAWGDISGILSAQTDLSEALGGKSATGHGHVPTDVTGTAVITTDSRLSDARTPTVHDNTKHSAAYIVQSNAVVPNTAITGATKTKLTYDAKGLITVGADATTADIADSTDKRYCTDAQKTIIGNTSGANTGDGAANSSSMYIGTTPHALNRASAAETLAGITLTTPVIGAATGTSLAATGIITSSGGGIGYATGAGGTITQLTSRTTGVTLSKLCGKITMFSSAVAAAASSTFVLTNTFIAATDMVIVQHPSATNACCWQIETIPAAGTCTIVVKNISAASITEATPLQFVVIKAVIA